MLLFIQKLKSCNKLFLSSVLSIKKNAFLFMPRILGIIFGIGQLCSCGISSNRLHNIETRIKNISTIISGCQPNRFRFYQSPESGIFWVLLISIGNCSFQI